MDETPSFEDWERGATEEQSVDPLWRMTAYRLAAYALEISWADAQALDRIRITRQAATQLYTAVGSISATLAEGYSRSSGPDRARFFEYALGSTRESIVWYRAGIRVLGRAIVARRIETLTRIRQLLLVAITRARTRKLRPRAREKW